MSDTSLHDHISSSEEDKESDAQSSLSPSPMSIGKRKQKGTPPAFQQMSDTSLHDNTFSPEEDEDIATVTLVPIAMSKRSKKKFPCTYCPEVISRKSLLTSHLFMHTDPKSVTCPICKQI